MEPRGATASYDAANDSYTLRVCSQGARAAARPDGRRDGHSARQNCASSPRMSAARSGSRPGPIRNTSRCWSARRRSAGRCTGWRAAPKSFLSDNQARDTCHGRRAGARREGQIPGAAHPPPRQHGRLHRRGRREHPDRRISALLPRHVRHPAHRGRRAKCVFTNTVPTAPYRGAGRPEANYVLERVVDEAARVTGIDPVRLRRRNLIPRRRCRTRPRSAPPMTAATSPPSSTRRWRSPTTRIQEARAKAFKRKEAARHRHLLRARACRRLADRGRAAVVSRRRTARARHQRAVDRTGPRHDLSAPGRPSGSASRPSRSATARRHRARDRRLRLGRFALGDDGGGRHRQDARRDAGEGQEDRRRRCWKPPKATSNTATALRSGRHRPPHDAVRGRGARQGDEEEGRNHRGPRHQGAPRRRRPSPTAATSPRSRSIPRPDRRRSSPMRRWTMRQRPGPHHCGRPAPRRGSRRASARRCWSRPSTTTAANSSPARSWTTPCRARIDMPPIKDDVHKVPATTNPLGVKGVGEAGTTGSIAAMMNAIANAIPGAAACNPRCRRRLRRCGRRARRWQAEARIGNPSKRTCAALERLLTAKAQRCCRCGTNGGASA